MHYEYHELSLADLDANDDTFRITTREDVDDLLCSIRCVGLLNPPFVKPKNGGGFQVVSGYRRIKACIELGFEKVVVNLLALETSSLECTKIAIFDNLLQRSLNLIENARSACLLFKIFPDQEELVSAARKMGIPDNPSYLMSLIKINSLSTPIQKMILNNQLALKMAVELCGFDPDIRIALVNVLSKLKLSMNLQKEIITHIKEIAQRDGKSITDITNDIRLLGVLENDQYDALAKTHKIRKYLKFRRYPEISSAEEKMKNKLATLKLPKGTKLIPPANFEGNTYTILFEFKTIKEFSRQTVQIRKLANLHELQNIIEI